jgi:hypothetical protein
MYVSILCDYSVKINSEYTKLVTVTKRHQNEFDVMSQHNEKLINENTYLQNQM